MVNTWLLLSLATMLPKLLNSPQAHRARAGGEPGRGQGPADLAPGPVSSLEHGLPSRSLSFPSVTWALDPPACPLGFAIRVWRDPRSDQYARPSGGLLLQRHKIVLDHLIDLLSLEKLQVGKLDSPIVPLLAGPMRKYLALFPWG